VLILLASGTAYLPHVVGGVEINTHELAPELNQRGLATAVLSKLPLRNIKCAYRAARNFVRGRDISADHSGVRNWFDRKIAKFMSLVSGVAG
jgi:hypothetical protein